ncbi:MULTISPECIES: histidine kinase dimerization/phosphoacceptor domain-containing protein [unclassified Pseudonocardia]|uniref:histidine kinase dimerization/phosphoacceptor domain-containing protein n=1 Tax=unclassified Pseudonocardia TaxID=2619320 RepID=UPI0025DED4DC|nr:MULTISPECIES: histidine kinase dimerization/phosphoacceptor domain-containing protein [unclassified Pseudonocardia]
MQTNLRSGVTYRRALHLLLGAVVLLPYVALGWIFAVSVPHLGVAEIVALAVPAVAVGIGVAFVPGVRTLEIAAARALLDVALPDPGPDTWPARRRAAAWLVPVAVLGGVAALLALLAVPWAVGLVLARWVAFPPFPTGAAAAWTPFAGLLLFVVLVEVLAGMGAGLARLAPALLGPSPADRLAAELERSRRAERAAAERNRLARELHDSIGHALTVTTLQAGGRGARARLRSRVRRRGPGRHRGRRPQRPRRARPRAGCAARRGHRGASAPARPPRPRRSARRCPHGRRRRDRRRRGSAVRRASRGLPRSPARPTGSCRRVSPTRCVTRGPCRWPSGWTWASGSWSWS